MHSLTHTYTHTHTHTFSPPVKHIFITVSHPPDPLIPHSLDDDRVKKRENDLG